MGSGWEVSIERRGTNYVTLRPITPPPPTLESKETKNSTVQCKENNQKLIIPDMKNVNKSENHCSPVKLESKKQDKKVLALRVGLGWEVSDEEPRPKPKISLTCFTVIRIFTIAYK